MENRGQHRKSGFCPQNSKISDGRRATIQCPPFHGIWDHIRKVTDQIRTLKSPMIGFYDQTSRDDPLGPKSRSVPAVAGDLGFEMPSAHGHAPPISIPMPRLPSVPPTSAPISVPTSAHAHAPAPALTYAHVPVPTPGYAPVPTPAHAPMPTPAPAPAHTTSEAGNCLTLAESCLACGLTVEEFLQDGCRTLQKYAEHYTSILKEDMGAILQYETLDAMKLAFPNLKHRIVRDIDLEAWDWVRPASS